MYSYIRVKIEVLDRLTSIVLMGNNINIHVYLNVGEQESGKDLIDAEGDVLSVTEIDLIDQIRIMYEKDGKKATAIEEAEWLKSIREMEPEEDC